MRVRQPVPLDDVWLRHVESPSDRLVAERLWLMFRHDLSGFRGQLPNPDGTFRSDRFTHALDDPDCAVMIAWAGEHPVALVIVRALRAPVRVIFGFFVVAGARRSGVGRAVVRRVLATYPGTWKVAFQDDNPTAVAFWRTVATEASGTTWTEERLPVPGEPDLPPDVWITFTAAPHASAP